MARSQPNTQIDLIPAAAVLGVLAIAALLWFRQRSEYAEHYAALEAPTPCAQPEAPRPALAPSRATDSPPALPDLERKKVAAPTTAQRADAATTPCADIEGARATFERAIALLDCREPAIAPLAKQFLDKVAPSNTRHLTPELAAALVEAQQAEFADAHAAVRKELGPLAQREPDAFLHDASLPPGYEAIRHEVHADRHGKRRPMIVVYSGNQGLGYAIPSSEAGRRFVLLHVTHNEAREPEWVELLLPQQPR